MVFFLHLLLVFRRLPGRGRGGGACLAHWPTQSRHSGTAPVLYFPTFSKSYWGFGVQSLGQHLNEHFLGGSQEWEAQSWPPAIVSSHQNNATSVSRTLCYRCINLFWMVTCAEFRKPVISPHMEWYFLCVCVCVLLLSIVLVGCILFIGGIFNFSNALLKITDTLCSPTTPELNVPWA